MSVEEFIKQGTADFKSDFIDFLRKRAVAKGWPCDRLSSYTLSDGFNDLNRKYNGRGPFYLGLALHEMLSSNELRFKEDDNAGDVYILAHR
ncbi:hypothetical protein J4217_04050 [Candidatus Pacearchaeota archaeon]|nr:hypothetical protein [Candidatus Pacearchaeota archaeon]